jgi:hypothetical protein
MRPRFISPLPLIFATAMLAVPAISPAQEAAVSVVPHLIKYSATLPSAPSTATAAEVKFALYAAPAGGEALWSETQQVALDSSGRYSVLLGSVTALPNAAFANGAARWIGVTLSGQEEAARTVLVATPYSLKASDAETLGGHPASDFTLKNALPASGTDITQIDGSNGVVVNGSGTGPTVTLGLSSSYLETLGNGIYPQLGGTNKLTGKNTFTAGNLLLGTSPVLSAASVTGTSPVTATVSGNTVKIGLSDSALLTLGNGVYAQLAAANTFTKPITFASGQSFPGTVALSANNAFTGKNSFSKAITFAAGQTFPGAGTGTITGITTSSPLSGSGTSGSVALSLNTSALENTLNSTYPTLAANNSFGGSNTFAQGVIGETDSTTQYSAGIYGKASTTGGLAAGVYGLSGSVSGSGAAIQPTVGGIGVWADESDDPVLGAALFASADNSYGAIIENNSNAGNATLYLLNNAAFTDLLDADNSNGTSCHIDNHANFYCSGTVSTTNSTADGQNLTSYAVQSSENWMEDFGTARLAAGSAHVTIDPAFAATVNTGVDYHVFLTPEGDCKGVYIAQKSADGFDVRELGGGKSSIAFDYRVVAKRKGFESLRLTDATPRVAKQQERLRRFALPPASNRPPTSPTQGPKPAALVANPLEKR